MSRKVGGSDQRGGPGAESGLEALRQSPEFRGPGDPPKDHDHANDHLALLYEDRDEQFAAAVPFIRQGLERGEQCLYVADDNSREEVLAAMRAYDIDVDTALGSGALAVLTPADTYRRTDAFDRDTMLEFWEDSLEQAVDEEGYTGLRAAAEMTWALDGDTGADELAEYEAVLNPLYQDEDYTVLCQYSRERFPTEVIHDVIKTHPHLIINNTVSQNFYYTPPEQFFGSEDLETKVNRMTQTLREHTEAKTEVHEHNEYLRELYEVTADSDRSFEEKLHTIFELGCDRFDLDLGGLARIDPETDLFEVEVISGDHEHLKPGAQVALSETYCRVLSDVEIAGITDPVGDGLDGILAYTEFGVESYLGTRIELDAELDRTLFFVASEPRPTAFSDTERTLHHLMGQWVQYELERQQREQELREHTEYLNALIETTPECIKTVGPDGTLFQMNPAGLEMVDADVESDVVGECVYDLIAPEDRERFRAFNERICQGESGTLEFGIIGLEGTHRHMETHAAPLHRPDGSTVQVALTRDITDQIEREQQLAETVDQLQQSNDRLKQFAYAASHDLQEPLRMVSSYLQLLENGYKADLDEDAREYIDFAVSGADRMRAMVNDLLAFSRVEQGDKEFKSVDCNGVLDRVTDDLRVKIEENNAEISVESLPTIRADSEQLEQIFSNLVSNAIKYSGDEPPAVEITVEERTDHWVFAVADNGIGIDPEKTDRIFEVFKRLHHENEYPGTGIGLSLCQKIAENHGGDIWVDSEPGEGSTFFFTIPKQVAE